MLYHRDIVEQIIPWLESNEILVLHGARQVGKTSILSYLKERLSSEGKQVCYIDLEDSRYLRILDAGVDEFLRLLAEQGFAEAPGRERVYVFIDEIQYLANPSSFLKLIADHQPGLKLIVSGSSSFAIREKFSDSLVGRTIHFEIFPLSFQETLRFRGIPFVESEPLTELKSAELRDCYRDYALYGGYPRIVLTPEVERKERYLQQIIDTYVRKDIRDLAGVKDIDKYNRLLEALAGQSGGLLNVDELANTARLAKQTVEKYLFIMENTYVIRLVRPFSGNIRTELFKQPKIFFHDTGLMQMLWFKGLHRELLGNVFETSLFSELVKRFGQENVRYWRTKDKREIDFILTRRDKLLALEVKLNFAQCRQAALAYFSKHYDVEPFRVVALHGDKPAEHGAWPWEIG
jgi:predicted AAA+ superfamily ATPase